MRTNADVAIVGFGPAGAMLASLLGQRGHTVVAMDKFPKPYELPRMSTLDGEVARLLQHAADPKEALAESLPERLVELWGADGERKGHFDWDYKRAGHMSHLSLHQPNIEAAMAHRIAQHPNVDVRWGRTAVDLVDITDGGATVVATTEDGTTEEVRATYVIGMDGASSFVREKLGIDLEVLHVHDDQWILTDYDVLEPLPNNLEERVYFDLEFTQPYFYAPNGVGRVRTDVRVIPGTDIDDELTEERGLQFMEEHVGVPRTSIRQTRRKLYRFRSQIATSMRKGRVFIGGDAAHAMTPYMGQGACTAMRDAANLAWKLDLVLSGRADAGLLDSYEPERLGQGRFFVEGSYAAFKMINPATEAEAAERDAYLEATGGDVTPPIPPIGGGVGLRTVDGDAAPQAGEVAPQGVVTIDGRTELLDDVVGYGFHLVSTLPIDEVLTAEQSARLAELGVIEVKLGDVVDADGTYRDYFEKWSATSLISRPDGYVFGLADSADDLRALVDHLLDQIPVLA
ncbi:3-(3-hydroxyphenyl)propionate hydroxylase [Gordonia spumicola]|uniref:3-(3-hydroxyphenyl)propionate hydroxylase n=1 Tax=Gordonia spumicola TaxID=589161 RepID=A0A7I9V5U9_9ACTN|nr:bifunctional 3-(3-hydroxy-phenyl)propionate/3-hydroxycinnamic acid hydroxylase [Gordonia spumicola]GEE00798.1 3-(3-hydroxyphenyl)propionate hydroxylase [Gordonia spumicola]GEE04090.1 3-(3-hydroxyphenyl)propionate hydroxylase [Gordonia spumicola]